MDWSSIPDDFLSVVMDYLRPRDKYRVSMVCRRWYQLFWYPTSWKTFTFQDYVFTRRKFTIHAGYQFSPDYYRIRHLISVTGPMWRCLIIKPVKLLFNLYEFLRALTNYSEYYGQGDLNPFVGVKEFQLTWKLYVATAESSEQSVYGTGGTVLNGIRNCITRLHSLQTLCLQNLLLDSEEAELLLGDLLSTFGNTLKTLSLFNLTKRSHSFVHLAMFLSLRKLIIGPQNLSSELIIELAQHQFLCHLIVKQDENTKDPVIVPSRVWLMFKARNPTVQVHLRCVGTSECEMIWQPDAPVVSIAYSNPAAKLTFESALVICSNYEFSLKSYVQKGIQRRYRSKAFGERADEGVMQLVRYCRNLEMLAIREHLSTATVILASHYCSYKDKFWLIVRRNALLKKRMEWECTEHEWSRTFYEWLRVNSRDYDSTQHVVAELLRYDWRPYTDSSYKYAFKKDL